MGGTRKNPSNETPSDLTERMTKIEAKLQQGLEKLRKDYIDHNATGSSSPSVFEEKLKSFEYEIRAEIKRMNENILLIQSKVSKNERNINKIMHGNNNKKLLFRGIPENNGRLDIKEDLLSMIHKNLGVNIDKNEIASCYRLKRKNNKQEENRPSPLIVEFVTQWRRDEIFYNKNRLKGKNIMVCEMLSTENYSLLLKVREKFKNKSWTDRGRILVFHNNRKIQIADEKQLEELVN